MTKHGVAGSQLAVKRINITTENKQPRAGSSEDSLKKVLGMVDEWLKYRKKLIPAWERDTKLYNNERVKRHYKGLSDTFVPMTYSTLESISAALVTGDLNTDFVPQDIYKYLKDRLMPGFTGTTTDPDGNEVEETEEQYLIRAIQNVTQGGAITDESLEVLNALYDYIWDKDDWEEKFGEMIDSGLQIGNGALWMILENGLPKLISVPFPDYVFSARGMSDDTMPFAGRRYLGSLKALREEVIADPKTGETKKRYKNLDKVTKRDGNSGDDKTNKEMLEELLLGSTLDMPKDDEEVDQVEVIEIMNDERMYTLINRKVLAEDEENFIVSQAKLRGIDPKRLITIPGITWANNKKPSLFIGRSETSTFWQEQERLNDSTNQKSDAVTQSLLRQKRADPSLKSQKNAFGVPGAVIYAQAGQYEAISNDIVPNGAFNEEMSIKNNIRETTATDQIVKGVGSTSDVTATEAKLQVAQSGQRIEKKIKSLENGPLKRTARLALQYIRLFVVDPFIVPQKVNNGINPLLYDPKKYDYDFEPKVTLNINAQNKRRQEQNDSIETYKMLIADPTNNLQEVKKIMLPKIVDLDSDEIDRIVQPQEQPMPGGGMPETMPPAAGMPPQPLPQGLPA